MLLQKTGSVSISHNGTTLKELAFTGESALRFDFDSTLGMNRLGFKWNVAGVDNSIVNVDMKYFAVP